MENWMTELSSFFQYLVIMSRNLQNSYAIFVNNTEYCGNSMFYTKSPKGYGIGPFFNMENSDAFIFSLYSVLPYSTASHETGTEIDHREAST